MFFLRFSITENAVFKVKDAPHALEYIPTEGKITVEGLGFEYTSGKRVIDKLQFEVKSGQTIALVS